MTAYLSYLMGDVLGFSGILSLFVCAVAISHYALHNISGTRCQESRPPVGMGVGGGLASQSGGASSDASAGPPPSQPAGRWQLSTRPPHLASPPTSTPRCAVESRTTTIYAFHTLSYVSEGIIFVYCGLDALDPLKWQVGRAGCERAGWRVRCSG